MDMATVDERVAAGDIWDASNYAGKPHLLRVVRESSSEFFRLLEAPENWDLRINPLWAVSDLAAHMVDVIEGYLVNFDLARTGQEPPAPFGTRVMGQRLHEQVVVLREVPRGEILERLHRD